MKVYKGGKPSGSENGNGQNPLRVSRITESGDAMNDEAERRYAAALLDLAKPYHADLPDFDEMEALLNLAVIAWNLSNMKTIVPDAFKTMWTETKENFGSDKGSIQRIEKMLKEKTKNYAGDDRFITKVDVDLTEKNELLVWATVKPLDEFLADVTDEADDNDEINYQPGYVNRSAMVVMYKQPFLDWMENTAGEPLQPQDRVENTVYLIEERETSEEIDEWLQTNFERIFVNELEAWEADKETWPSPRSYQLFQDWFDVSYERTVYDLEDFPVDKNAE